jgi:hypothetical protein
MAAETTPQMAAETTPRIGAETATADEHGNNGTNRAHSVVAASFLDVLIVGTVPWSWRFKSAFRE